MDLDISKVLSILGQSLTCKPWNQKNKNGSQFFFFY